MGHWCEFCQMEHSSASCYHPANKPKRVWVDSEKDMLIAQLRTDLRDAVGLLRIVVNQAASHQLNGRKDLVDFLTRPSVMAVMGEKP